MHLVVLAALAVALPDRGIFPELDGGVSTALPEGVSRERAWLRVDRAHRVVTLFDGDDPVKAYPLVDGGRAIAPGVTLRTEDADEVAAHLPPSPRVTHGAPSRTQDHDGDGIVDRLDILLGAKKLLANRARYIERYRSIKYPGGDVPRTEGVCTDTVIRALRNAGVDLQKEVHEDIVRARRAYPMVEKVDTNINHRRVRTILPWFRRHWRELRAGERRLPGDVVFFDTFPSRAGPDHLGVVSDNGKVINNWTDGTVDAEMDLLSWVPVTHHFRSR
jgi:uncharacterized protein YijF (DUF1287 family)